MNFIKSNVLGLIKIIPANIPLLAKLTGQKIIFPFYHTISDKNSTHTNHLYQSRSEKLFHKDLDFLLKHYKSINLEQVVNLVVARKKSSEYGFHLTFDDGLRDVYEVVAPILKKRGIAATFFLNSDFVDNKSLFYRHQASILIEALSTKNYSQITLKETGSYFKMGKYSDLKAQLLSVAYENKDILLKVARTLEIDFNEYLKKERPYMTSDQIEELIHQGFTIGAHSIDHPLYNTLGLNEQVNQTDKSMKFIVDIFNPQYKVFAFPFTDDRVSKEFFEIIFNKDNKIADLTFGTAGLKKDIVIKNIQRIPMETSTEEAESIIAREYLYYLCKFPFGRNTLKRL